MRLRISALLLALLMLLAGCIALVGPATTTGPQSAPIRADGEFELHMIDVGQGDALLLQCGGYNMMVDAGKNNQAQTAADYLAALGVTRLEYLVGTHPDEDHIGGLDVFINTFEIGTLMMPKVTKDTKTFEDVMDAAIAKGLQAEALVPGNIFSLGSAEIEVLSPRGDYPDVNNYSIVLRVTFGQNTFLLMGDAEYEIEHTLVLEEDFDLKSNLLKCGHHGSNSSSSLGFLRAVAPQYALISCGEDNSYGHPRPETMTRLAAIGADIYRTDIQGTIIAVSDGQNIVFNQPPSESGETETVYYIGNRNSKLLHTSLCAKQLPAEKNQERFDSLFAAVAAGYSKYCDGCKP